MHKSIYKDRNLNTTIILFFISAMMIGFSIYLTQHYFALKFPTGLEGQSICNVNQFFNCDKTTFSVISNIAGIPIALFGALIGFFVMIGLFFKNEQFERTLYFTLIVNFIGCVLLFAYSIIVLKGLCPFCTIYYILSGIALFLFYRHSSNPVPDAKYLGIFLAVTLVISGVTKMNINSKEKAQGEIAQDLIRQFYSLPNLGVPSVASEFKIADAPDAPIKMAIFSDFECPACKALSEQVQKITARYSGKIDIQYYYYPLDHNCNANMDRPLHQNACKAAYVTTCMPAKEFGKVHDDIFHNQEKIAEGFLDEYIKKHKLEDCVASPATKEKVIALIKASDPFNIRSTPSYLVNGVKIEGILPADQMYAILDEILRRAQK